MEIEIHSALYLSNTDYLTILYKCNHRPTGRCHHWLYGRPISVQLYEPDLLVGKIDDEYLLIKNKTDNIEKKFESKEIVENEIEANEIEDEFDLDLEPMKIIF